MDVSEGTDQVASVSPAFVNRESTDLRQATPELMNVSPMSDDSPGQMSHSAMLESLRQREWLHAQKIQLQAELDACTPGFATEIDDMSADDLHRLHDQLKNELVEKSVIRDSRELLLRGELLNQTALAILNNGQNVESGDGNLDKELEAIIGEFSRLSAQVSKEHQDNVQLKTDMEEIKKENFKLLKRSRQLYEGIDAKKKATEEEIKTLTTDAKGISIHEKLKTKLQWCTVLNNTLQGLILGSGINWAEDPQLQKLLLDAGKNINI